MFNRVYLPQQQSLTKYPYINANRLTNQSIANGVTTGIIFNNIITTDNNYYSLNTGTGVVTILQTGVYLFTLNTIWSVSALGIRLALINIVDSGNTYSYWKEFTQLGIIPTGLVSVSCHQKLAFTNASISFGVYQNSGAALNLGTGNINLAFNIIRLSDV